MKKVTVELDWDTVVNIVIEKLKDTLHSLEIDCESRQAGHGFAVFDLDRDVDTAIMREHIRAFKLVLSYYGGKILD